MIDDATNDLAVLYVFDALPPTDLAAFLDRLDSEPELRAHLDSLQEAAAALAHLPAPIPAPVGIAERIVAHSSPRATAVPIRPNSRHTLPQFLPWALAAGIAILATFFATQAEWQREKVRSARQEADKARDAALVATQQANLAKLTLSRLAAQDAAYNNVNAFVAWDDKQQKGFLQMDRLQWPGNEKDYQLWIIDPASKTPISAGVIKLSPDGRVTQSSFRPLGRISSVAKFAVSLEKKGGAQTPQGPIVLVTE
jgi:anti-sigma-K factor RskA